jgi:hypothetical protein
MQLLRIWHHHCSVVIKEKMKKRKNLGRNVFLAIGIIVGILIFILGSNLNHNLRHSNGCEFNTIESPNNLNPIVNRFFS